MESRWHACGASWEALAAWVAAMLRIACGGAHRLASSGGIVTSHELGVFFGVEGGNDVHDNSSARLAG
jgi:hypothetical protein